MTSSGPYWLDEQAGSATALDAVVDDAAFATQQ